MGVSNKIDELLNACRVTPHSDPEEGGKFYRIRSQEFKLADGTIIRREYVDKRPAAVVVPVTKNGNILAIVQPIALSEEGSLIELPAGYAEGDELSAQAAMRELLEETGYSTKNIIPLGKHYQDPGLVKTPVYAFLALECERIAEQRLDEGENIKTIEISVEEMKRLMKEDYILDANTYIALSKAMDKGLI